MAKQMISRIYAEVLREIRRLGGELFPDQEFALTEIEESIFVTTKVGDYGKRKLIHQYLQGG